jgi:hypothetical protein
VPKFKCKDISFSGTGISTSETLSLARAALSGMCESATQLGQTETDVHVDDVTNCTTLESRTGKQSCYVPEWSAESRKSLSFQIHFN